MENKPCLGFAMVSVFPEFCFIFSHYPRHRKFLYIFRSQLHSLILNRRCSLFLIVLFLMNLCYTLWHTNIQTFGSLTYDSHLIFFSSLFSLNIYTFFAVFFNYIYKLYTTPFTTPVAMNHLFLFFLNLLLQKCIYLYLYEFWI